MKVKFTSKNGKTSIVHSALNGIHTFSTICGLPTYPDDRDNFDVTETKNKVDCPQCKVFFEELKKDFK